LLYARLGGLAWGSLLVAGALGAAWFVLQAALIAGADTVPEALSALAVVALETQFGQLLLCRFGLLLVLLVWLRHAGLRRTHGAGAGAIILAAAALGMQPAIGHAGAIEGVAGFTLLNSEALHVWAAGAWLGALLPLLICLATMPSDAAAIALRRFFPLGLITITIIVATSVVQGVYLLGSVPALIGTAYGQVTLLKMLLFLVLLGFGAVNRLLLSTRPGGRLRHSITGETLFALGVTLAAGFLAHLTPGAHDQPVWPLSWRLDPTAPGLTFVAAYPSSFLLSPTGFSAASIVHGQRLYQANCAACHGTAGYGDGPLARSQTVAPTDLTARHLLDYSDGDLFWFAGHAVQMVADDQWDLVDYLRAHNTGEFVRIANRSVQPHRIPSFTVNCADGRNLRSNDLRAAVWRLETSLDTEADSILPDVSGRLTTIMLPEAGGPVTNDTGCVAQQETREAFAILLGITPQALSGTEFLVDPNGWLRWQWNRAEHGGGWPTPERLSARILALADHPLPLDAASGHVHR
jgi:putative copper export protein/mono/diheme cytochrome c family protein